MSKKIVEIIDNIVDKKNSEYYLINKRRRFFWHSKSITISWRVREENDFNKVSDMALNIRAFLLNEEKYFNKVIISVMKVIEEKDMKQLRSYVYSRYPNISRKELDKNMGLIIGNLSEEEIKGALGLNEVVSCRLLGYEKELFYLKCYWMRILPVFMLRVLYHTKYSHLKLKHLLIEKDSFDFNSLHTEISFESYLDKITFK